MARPRKNDTAPSQRDHQVFAAAWIEQRPQRDVAQQFGLSQGRVSQIVARVRKWRAENLPEGAGGLDLIRRKRATHTECRDRMYTHLAWASDGFQRSLGPLVTKKEGHRDGKEYAETVTKQQRADTQMLKVAIKLNEQLLDFEDRLHPPPLGPKPGPPISYGEGVALQWLALVRRGGITLEEAQFNMDQCSITTHKPYPSLFALNERREKEVAFWVRRELEVGPDPAEARAKYFKPRGSEPKPETASARLAREAEEAERAAEASSANQADRAQAEFNANRLSPPAAATPVAAIACDAQGPAKPAAAAAPESEKTAANISKTPAAAGPPAPPPRQITYQERLLRSRSITPGMRKFLERIVARQQAARDKVGSAGPAEH